MTNAEFAEFVDATGYVTVAERPLNPADYPDAPAENLQPGSMVFHRTRGPGRPAAHQPVVDVDAGRMLEPPARSALVVRKRENHPVVHVAFEDAEAYANWAGLALADRGASGRSRPAAAWTARPTPGATSRSGPVSGWPTTGTASFRICPTPATAPPQPVGSFARQRLRAVRHGGQRLGVDDRLVRRDTRATEPCCAADSYDPRQPQFRIPRKVIKGGSFLCADSYCLRYRPAARRPQMVDTGHEPYRVSLRITVGTCEDVRVKDGGTHYARNGSVRLAYRVLGEGDTTLVWNPGWFSNVDLWTDPALPVRVVRRRHSRAEPGSCCGTSAGPGCQIR